ncbi:MAG: 6-bladed beta-propeller, partial [Bacteroidales bacterium]|nr:6-bladed beta-propeller [Bacteroidales bacterium]
MKFKSITPICCLLILFCAAQNSLFAQNKAEAIDVAGALENNDVVNMTEYFSSIDYIPLGEGEVWVPEATSCNIFYADKENFYLTFGERKNRGCFKFTGEGKYVTSFVEKGTWTHEFINVSDITACKENGNIALCDNNKIVIFSSDGKWITTLFVYHILGEAGCVRDIYFEGPNRVRFLWYQESLNRVSVICMDLKGNLLHRK